jgi:hypothetical protein
MAEAAAAARVNGRKGAKLAEVVTRDEWPLWVLNTGRLNPR